MAFDLLTTVEYGGCSAKLSPQHLAQALQGLVIPKNDRVLVDIETHDDAGVYKISDTMALIQTTDFFSPICSDPFEFGQIAAANALSDVYAMGGAPLTALNLVMFPSNKIPLDVLRDILAGGLEKINENGEVILGGQTIDDYPPKYGLAVTGTIHPDKIITNAAAKPGDAIILTKPIGTGTIAAGKRIGECAEPDYAAALASMKVLNKHGCAVMQKYDVKSGTDITGFGLLGHALKLAHGSKVTIKINSITVPLMNGAYELADLGCIPGAAFRNLDFVDSDASFTQVDYTLKMLLCDAQTSGGIFMCIKPEHVEQALSDLRNAGHTQAACIGEVLQREEKTLQVV